MFASATEPRPAHRAGDYWPRHRDDLPPDTPSRDLIGREFRRIFGIEYAGKHDARRRDIPPF